jgi:site-specific DNA recombinase
MNSSEQARPVGVWVRVSTEDQVKGESPEHHERRARAYAEAKGWHVREVYRLEAVSGKAVIGHAESQRMLADIRAGHITALVFSKLARLARNTRELLDFAELFRAAGADLVSLQESIDTSTPAGRLFFTLIAAMAQWEREEIADRVRASVPVRAQMGKQLGGQASFGYRWENHQLVVDRQEAPVRRLIYELFDEHRRVKTVARLLNERGYRTRKGVRFTDTTVSRLLLDETAKGVHRANYTATSDRSKGWSLKPETDWVRTTVPAIVSEELWDTCAQVLSRRREGRRPARKAAHLFAGFAYCTCGAKMYVWSNSPKYRCAACNNKIPVDDLEAVYREQLREFLLSPDEIDAHAAAAKEAIAEKTILIEATEAELRKVEAEEDRLYQLYMADGLSKEDFARRNKPVSARRAQLVDELPRLQADLTVLQIGSLSRDATLSDAQGLAQRWGDLAKEEKRQIIESITDRIVIGKDQVEIHLIQVAPFGNSADLATRPQGFMAATSWNLAG